MNNVAIVAITKNGLNLGKKIHDKFTHWVANDGHIFIMIHIFVADI